MSCRESLSFSSGLESDAAPLNHLIAEVLAAAPHTRCFRDPTRGGLASTLNELASQSGTDITVEEDAVPVKPAVLGACEMLGYDPLQVANEGKMVCVVAPDEADAALAAMRANRYGADAAIIGEVAAAQPERGPKVFLRASSTCSWASSCRASADVGRADRGSAEAVLRYAEGRFRAESPLACGRRIRGEKFRLFRAPPCRCPHTRKRAAFTLLARTPSIHERIRTVP